MSRRVSRNNTYTTGVSPSGFFRAEVVGVDGSYLSVKIPRLGLDNVYENVPFTGFTPSVGDKIWISFIEGKSAHILAFVGAGDTTTDITEVVAGTNLTGGGSSGAVTLSLDPNIIGDISIDGSVGTGNLTVSGDGFDDTMFSIVKSGEGAGYIKKGTGYLEIYALNDAETLNQDILFSGNVGIGVATPTDTLHVEGNIRVPSDSLLHNGKGEDVSFDGLAHTVELRTRNLSRVFVDGQGNVGINESAPSYTLDVNGTGRFTEGVALNRSYTTSSIFINDRTYCGDYVLMNSTATRTITTSLVTAGTFNQGDQITFIRQNTGAVNFVAGSNTEIRSRNGDLSIAYRYSAATLICDATDGSVWYLVGDLT